MDGQLVNGAGFHNALRAVLARTDITYLDKAVMAYMLDRASQDGLAWPSVATIAAAIGTSPRRATASLSRLRKTDLVVMVNQGGGLNTSKYLLTTPDKNDTTPPTETALPPDKNDGGPPTKTTPNRLIDRLNTDSKTEEAAAPPVGRVRPVKLNAVLLAVEIPASLNTPAFCELWTEWVLERKARGKSLTERGARMQLTTLEAMGPTAAMASIRQSIEKGWTGLFEPKDTNGRPAAVVHNDVEF